MIVYRVYTDGYDGGSTLRVFADRDAAVAFARGEARRSNEEFGGGIGESVCVEALDTETGEASDLEDWQNWTVKVEGAHFVVASDDLTRVEP